MNHSHAGRVLRFFSYLVLLIGMAWLIWDGAQPSSGPSTGSVSTMGHIGAGIGSAIEWLGALVCVSVIAAALNGASLLRAAKPPTMMRKFEFFVFCLPFAGAVAIFILMFF